MKNWVLCFVFLSSLTAAAAPKLLTGPERELYIKALVAALNQSGIFVCTNIDNKTNETWTFYAKSEDLAKKALKIPAEKNIYLDNSAGSQPVIQLTGPVPDTNNTGVTSFVSDPSYKKIIRATSVTSELGEVNVGNLLNPDFQIRPIVIFTQDCQAQD